MDITNTKSCTLVYIKAVTFANFEVRVPKFSKEITSSTGKKTVYR